MQTEPKNVSEELQQKAKVCETIAQDKTEESLTGDSAEKVMNEEEAKAWREKSQIWTEAEALVRSRSTDPISPAK